ncbi:MAG: hypothetical protein JNN07_12050 [Verrucomicrobiales bacterium]|nr:hypothetical protein [Verrucomicrobiales bacterium]
MEKVKKLVELAKANYEKAILVLVVLILAVAVGFLYWLSGEEQKKANETTGNYVRKKLNPPPALDMAAYDQGLKVALNPPRVDFGLPHKLFNPVKWMRGQDGKLIVDRSGKSVGPEALKIDSIKPLNLVVRLVSASNDSGTAGGASYVVELMAEAADRPEFRKPRPFTMKLDEKIRMPGGTARNPNQLWLREVKGKAEDPDGLVFELTETKERISVAKDKAFVRAEAYVAELSYPPEGRQYKGLRRDAFIGFGGEDYKIVEITENEVVVSNRLNEKKTRLKRTP